MTIDDPVTSVAQLRDLVKQFVEEREWNSFHNPKNLAMSLAIEAGELMEHFQWLSLPESARLADRPEQKHAVEEEVADCLAYILALANAMDIDLSTALRAKMIRNAEKYPVPPADPA
ncbi:MAG: nucleotide pyrophosphohydrolase [Pirellulales bacterium]|nr:nucleotide pyrophosphohydrolase [Pirellulales bacterium]